MGSLFEALCVLIVVRVALTLFSYRTVAASISLRELPHGIGKVQPFVKAWAVKQAAKIVPSATCLPQALALQYLLARRGQSSAVRIGVRVDETSEVDAHAWVVYRDRVLIGGASEDLAVYNVLTDLFPTSSQHG